MLLMTSAETVHHFIEEIAGALLILIPEQVRCQRLNAYFVFGKGGAIAHR